MKLPGLKSPQTTLLSLNQPVDLMKFIKTKSATTATREPLRIVESNCKGVFDLASSSAAQLPEISVCPGTCWRLK